MIRFTHFFVKENAGDAENITHKKTKNKNKQTRIPSFSSFLSLSLSLSV